MKKNPLTPAVRRYIYGVCIAAIPLLILAGVLNKEAAGLVLPLLLAVLNVNPE